MRKNGPKSALTESFDEFNELKKFNSLRFNENSRSTVPRAKRDASSQKKSRYPRARQNLLQHQGSFLQVIDRQVRKARQDRDTLGPKQLIALINQHSTFVTATQKMSLFPKTLYKLVESARKQHYRTFEEALTRVEKTTDFVLSLLEGQYFLITQQGLYDPNPENQRKRARALLINMIERDRPILTQYAGKLYLEKWDRN